MLVWRSGATTRPSKLSSPLGAIGGEFSACEGRSRSRGESGAGLRVAGEDDIGPPSATVLVLASGWLTSALPPSKTPACLQSDLDGELIIERLLSRREGVAPVVAEP